MAKTYKCPYANIEWDGITCSKDDKHCPNTRYCQYKGRQILTEYAEECPRRKEEKADADKPASKKRLSNKNSSGRV